MAQLAKVSRQGVMVRGARSFSKLEEWDNVGCWHDPFRNSKSAIKIVLERIIGGYSSVG
jgi:hypothetical protein